MTDIVYTDTDGNARCRVCNACFRDLVAAIGHVAVEHQKKRVTNSKHPNRPSKPRREKLTGEERKAMRQIIKDAKQKRLPFKFHL